MATLWQNVNYKLFSLLNLHTLVLMYVDPDTIAGEARNTSGIHLLPHAVMVFHVHNITERYPALSAPSSQYLQSFLK